MDQEPTPHTDPAAPESSLPSDSGVPKGAVVVGIDGSERDQTCLAWAAGAASRNGRPMHLLHAHNLAAELVAVDAIGAPGVVGIPPEFSTDTILPDALESARAQWPDLTITGSEPWMSSEQALLDASEEAYLLVVGSRRVSGLQRLLVGRSALAVSMHAHCPVVILPEGARTDADGPVVVGVDGSEHSRVAADRAFWIADVRGACVRVVISWHLEVVDGMVVTTPGTPAWEQVEARYRSVAESVTARAREAFPQVECEIVVRRGVPAQVLTEESASASLLVMGSRGRGGFRGMLLGSVTHKVLETATSPVMVVRHG